MRKIFLLVLCVLSVTAFGQPVGRADIPSGSQPNLGLIPTPQRVELAQGRESCVLAKAKIKELRVKWGRGEGANWSQMYRLIIEPRKVTIHYEGSEGRQHAYQTLAQLRQLHDTLPCMTITDWPAYRYRGWMDDISRGPVPHAAYRKKQWETLHALKYNFCNYYTEHTLYQKEFPDLAPAYAADCEPHPDEVINLQLFAHAEKTLRVPFYQHLMDSKANFNPDNEATYEFLRKRIAGAFERIPLNVSRDTRPPFFIINCDETEQLGTGRAKRLVDSLGTDQVYVNHINRCYDLIQKLSTFNRGSATASGANFQPSTRVVMWGDIVAKNPAMMRQLPKDMTYIMWAYEPLDSYDHLIKPFKENGTPFWVAPSLSHSSNMVPSPQRYMKNIANLARDGWRNGAEGLMNTCWDDNGEALFDNCWHGLFWSAEMAWNPIRTDDPEEFRRREAQFNENFARLFYGDTTLSNVNTLYEVGALESNPVVADWYTSAALMEPLLNFNPENTGDAMPQRNDCVLALINVIYVDSAANPHAHYAISRMKMSTRKANLRFLLYGKLFEPSRFDVPISTVDYFLEKLRELYQNELFDLKREYLRLWDQENGEYERYIVCNRYDDLAREVLELDRHVFMSVGYNAVSQHPTVTLRTLYNDRPIYYTLDGSEPTQASTQYTEPFPLERSATIKAICYNEYGEGVVSEQYLLSHLGMGAKITLNTPFATYKAIYSGGGEGALIDGIQGSNSTYADGHWQGYWGDSIDAVIDFGQPKAPSSISMRFMQNTFDWILSPTQIKVYTSSDGKEWRLLSDQHFDMDPRETGMRLKNYKVNLMHYSDGDPKIALGYGSFRYLRVVVPNPGPLPEWHPAPGQPSYLFTDEIVIR